MPNFTSAFNLSQAAAGVSEKALLVLPLVLLIIAREIDLSIASILALTSVVLGVLVRAEVPLVVAVPIVLLAGAAAGAFNGVLVTRLDLPSLVVTLGTLAMFRGVGYIILGSGSVNVFPDALTDLGIDNVPGTQVPWTIVPFLLLAPVFAVVLQHTPTGRRIYALGGNPDAARYAGVRSRRLRFMLFVVSGLVCAVAGIVLHRPPRQCPRQQRAGLRARRHHHRPARRDQRVRRPRQAHRRALGAGAGRAPATCWASSRSAATRRASPSACC